MIDRLEEVLGKAESSQLEELLRPWGVAAAAPVKRDAASEESAAAEFSESAEGLETGRLRHVFETELALSEPESEEQAAVTGLLRGTQPAALSTGMRRNGSASEEVEIPQTSVSEGMLSEGFAAGGALEPVGFSPVKRVQAAAALAESVGRAAERLTLSAPMRTENAALLNLYRQTAQAVAPVGGRGAAPTPVVMRERPAAGNGLSVQELDLAVRRDSRCYDGAVHIY